MSHVLVSPCVAAGMLQAGQNIEWFCYIPSLLSFVLRTVKQLQEPALCYVVFVVLHSKVIRSDLV